MKISAILTAGVVAITSLIGSVSAEAGCSMSQNAATKFWEIKISDVDDPPAVCHLLWESLKRWPGCTVQKPNGCGAPFGGNEVYMWFATTIVCSSGMIKSSYWHATHNRYGAIKSC
ncbi:hypothetical protein CcaCcLH18_11273 [Colletotrichum camelliae]|nr:hypothetical protein CcaCcLH18_11273 [Colletotrichum camelliae]